MYGSGESAAADDVQVMARVSQADTDLDAKSGAQVNQLKQITFKDIITQYKRQAQARNAIFRTVPIQLSADLQASRALQTPCYTRSLVPCIAEVRRMHAQY
jgi:hypothetical protein